MRDSSGYSFVAALAPQESFLFLPSVHICSGQISLPYECTPHSWVIRPLVTGKTWLGHAYWSQDREATKWEISSCLIYSGHSHTAKRCANFWTHQLFGICFREVHQHIFITKVMCYFLYFLAKNAFQNIDYLDGIIFKLEIYVKLQ